MSDAPIDSISVNPAQPFAHLHCHTHYSLLDGANRIDQVVKKVKGAGMNSLAITDHGNLYKPWGHCFFLETDSVPEHRFERRSYCVKRYNWEM